MAYFGNKCLYCGEEKNLQLHHIIQRKDGGKDRLENLECVCFKCHVNIHKQIHLIKPRKSMKMSASFKKYFASLK